MDLKEHYDKLYQDSVCKIHSDAYQIDELIGSVDDNRYGITLLLRPDKMVLENIHKLLSRLKLIEPNQYYYRDSDIHVTVMSIISCYSGFQLSNIQAEDYVRTIEKSKNDLSPFEIEFRGLTMSPSCLMVQGFLEDTTLDQLRNKLRIDFKDSGLEQSIDKRYAIQTAHSTIFRLKEKFKDKNAFLKILEEYRDFYFGKFTVEAMELVYNDWYQRKEFVKILHKFELKERTYIGY
ncbi:2'-5' RNA ligase family protein [Belliella marina]|uniref:2'-5' RNA ligase family protein n=1 Tax=Belliella marina TaxID=1644146 RepID=A0ABW4VK42_9BACT